MDEFITPPPLNPGDKVAIVSPASGLAAVYPHVYDLGLERLRTVFDLEPVEFPTAKRSDEYLTNHPDERAADIEQAFVDPEIRGVIATIGGNDQLRILKHLDAEVLRNNPTRFFGISDNTNLIHYLWNQGIVSFYGGHLLTDFAFPGSLPEYLESSLRTALFDDTTGDIQPAAEFTDQDLDWRDPENLNRQPEWETNPGWRWYGDDGIAEGRTWGGSLEITHLQVATDRYLPAPEQLEGAVLLLELSEELPGPAAVQRMLLGMGERGLLIRFDGFLIGRVKARSHGVSRTPAERETYRRRVRETIAETITDYNSSVPIVCNVDFGHTNPVVPLPIGDVATIDSHAEQLAFGSGTGSE